MSTTPSNVVTDEATRTITIRQAEYSLQQGTFSKGYHHVVYASTVYVKRGFVNPGCDLTVFTARLVVDRAGGKIDVSGAAGKGFEPGRRADATTYKPNSHDGADAASGADGEPGQKGGAITIYAGRVEGGPLELVSRGGAGGRAQDGGNGKDGAQPPERPRPGPPAQVVVGYETIQTGQHHYTQKAKYGWSDDVYIGRHDFTSSYLLLAPGSESGARGGNGGHAGLAGRPGDGGKGGKITVRTLVPPAPGFARADVGGGEAGATASHGKPARGADGGLGAKYLYKAYAGLVSIDWSDRDEKSEWDKHWNTKNSKKLVIFDVDHFDNLGVKQEYIEKDGNYKKLKLRAPSGANGRQGGYGLSGQAQAPPVATASRGADDAFVVEKLDASGAAFRDVPYPYLLLLQRSVTVATVDQKKEVATDLLRWLLLLTAPYRDAASNAPQGEKDRQRLYHDTERALLSQNQGGPERAVRCIYKDIKLYSDFVETSLEHVERQEKYFERYQKAQENLTERKKVLEDAITEAQERIKHLAGDAMTAGSILYFQEKEKQLKTAISELDVQILDYQYRLENMPKTLQEEIDARIRKETELSAWRTLELVGMAAGVLINFGTAASSIMGMVAKVKDFYKEALDLTSWGEIFKDGLWNREFTDLKSDLSGLLETDEWKKLSTDRKEFVKSVTDFWGKVEAYEAIMAARKEVSFKLDRLDVQASVLVFDTGKLALKKKRNEFKAFVVKFVDEYEAARKWKHLFTDYFDTAETRFDLLAHLADVQAQRRELEYQVHQWGRNLAVLMGQLERLVVDRDPSATEDGRTTLEANLHLALAQGLSRIMDEGRAYKIWTLKDPAFPSIPANLTAAILRTKFHEPLWEKINELLSSSSLPAQRDASSSPFVWKRADYPQLFETLEKTGKMMLTVPVDPTSKLYFERLIDAKVYLHGATVDTGSAFHCVLRHRGVSEFVDRTGRVVTCYQEPRSIEFSYVDESGKPNYRHQGAIDQTFDDRDTTSLRERLARIRYSPYATWEVQVIRDYRPDSRSMVYNRNVDLAATQHIELRVEAFFENTIRPALRKAPPVPAGA